MNGNLAIIKDADFMTSDPCALADTLRAEGKLDEAGRVLRQHIATLSDEQVDEKVASLLRLGFLPVGVGDFRAALREYADFYSLVKRTSRPALKASYHNNLGIINREIGAREGILVYFDYALAHYDAALGYFTDAAQRAKVENNIAMVLCDLDRTAEAHFRLNKARNHFIDEPLIFAQIDETEARVYLKEGRPFEARSLVLAACATFERYNEEKLLADAWPTLMKAGADCQEVRAS